jgi:hypothetical protein
MKYQSDNTTLVLQAIENARQTFMPLEKNGVNNFFKNKKGEPHMYSTLDDIFNACLPSLRENNLSVTYMCQILKTENSLENILTTTITHIPSGQFILSATTLGNQTAKSQDVGSAITYLRRYQIQAMLNLEADFEDDGNLASGNKSGESNIVDIKEKTKKPKRDFVLYDEVGEVRTVVDTFATYVNEITKSLSTIQKHHACSSVTIIQLQDIYNWAEKLSEKDDLKKTANNVMAKCKKIIRVIKGE